jgi:hypothetical protein
MRPKEVNGKLRVRKNTVADLNRRALRGVRGGEIKKTAFHTCPTYGDSMPCCLCGLAQVTDLDC